MLDTGGQLEVGDGDVMSQDGAANPSPVLAGVGLRYPEKAFYLGQVFKDTTNSYKLVWFHAILSLIKRREDCSFRLADIFTEMAVSAWHPVCLYRLSLGRQDKLQGVVLEIKRKSALPPNATPEAIREFVDASPDAQSNLEYFKRYVPTRFLTPWFADKLCGEYDDKARTREIERMARESQLTPFASLYYLEGSGARRAIRLNDTWRSFLTENLGIVQSFAEHHLALYLQARNPNVPGVVHKLRAPTVRQLTAARDFWQFVRTDFDKVGKAAEFRDIYSERELSNSFSLDHFLPWSFVVHDLVWNLTTVEPATNSAKNDVLPDLNLYLPRLADLHFAAIEVAKSRPRLLEDYTDCFKLDAAELVSLSASSLEAKFREVILPQAQIAINQGFQSGWRMRSSAAVAAVRDELVGERRPAMLDSEEPVPANIIEIFPKESKPKLLSDYLPYYPLAIAAGGFLAGDDPEPEGWVRAVKHGFSKRLSGGMFVTRVVGESMSPTIKSGSYCVFRSPVEGTRQGRVVLVQQRNMTDPETGGTYTVKRYQSAKSIQEEGWRHKSIQLIPDNPDRQKFPILEFSPEDDADLRVVAEFIQMLSPAT